MGLSVWQEYVYFRGLDPQLIPPPRIYIAFYYAFRTLIPLPHHRTPWSPSNAYWTILPLLPLGFMAYLARRRDTFAMRLLLLPSVVFLALRAAYGCVYLHQSPGRAAETSWSV